MSVPSRRPLLFLLLALAAASPSFASPAHAAKPAPPAAAAPTPADAQPLPPLPADLAQRHRDFVDLAGPLMSAKEQAAFLALKQDYQRDAFVRQFWKARDPFPQTAVNEFEERWEGRARAAKEKFGNLTEDRARMMLWNGEPAHVVKSHCPEMFLPLEIWSFEKNEFARTGYSLVFVAPAGSTWRLWYPSQGITSLLSFDVRGRYPEGPRPELIEEACAQGSEILSALGSVIDWTRVEKSVQLAPHPSEEWLSTFSAYSTDLPQGAAAFPAELAVTFPGRYGSRTVVQGLLSVPKDEVKLAKTGDFESYDFVIDGEVLRKEELFEHFRYRFTLPVKEAAAQIREGRLPLIFQRYLRPGPYTLIVKIEDVGGKRYFRDQRELEVPAGPITPPTSEVTAAAPANPPTSPGATGRDPVKEANSSLHAGDQTIRLLPPPEGLVTGKSRVEAVTTGEGIARVIFLLNGKPILSKARPPYSVELALGEQPKIHSLKAVAQGPGGEELAQDEVFLNAGPHRFSLRLLEPQPGKTYHESLRANAEVKVPEGETLERVEFYLNETRIATLYQPPFAQPMVLPPGDKVTYVRAVAYLADGGNSTEDTVLVNSPNPGVKVQVDLVELYTSVVDKKGRPVQGLEAKDFKVFEDGAEQQVRRFDLVKDVPIYACILLDTSGSMDTSLHEAVEGALRFFDKVITPRDRAAVVTFADKPNLAVKFTNNHEVLAGGLANLTADGNTALYDSLVYTLYLFGGIKGKRAIVLLSDGKDDKSRYTFPDALEYARRTGVTIYTIGLGLTTQDADVRLKLQKLAEETGGRHFLIEKAVELDSVYKEVEGDLRSQYLLAYESTQGGAAAKDKYRTLEVKVAKPGLTAKTLRGYYP
ncbi:MAG: Ca-activated chloride channel [Acidobacteriota bacterium]|jgi:VWFA-related protein|nr:Ca-activated chloride channel [Acidobacteriota bacterium]